MPEGRKEEKWRLWLHFGEDAPKERGGTKRRNTFRGQSRSGPKGICFKRGTEGRNDGEEVSGKRSHGKKGERFGQTREKQGDERYDRERRKGEAQGQGKVG